MVQTINTLNDFAKAYGWTPPNLIVCYTLDLEDNEGLFVTKDSKSPIYVDSRSSLFDFKRIRHCEYFRFTFRIFLFDRRFVSWYWDENYKEIVLNLDGCEQCLTFPESTEKSEVDEILKTFENSLLKKTKPKPKILWEPDKFVMRKKKNRNRIPIYFYDE